MYIPFFKAVFGLSTYSLVLANTTSDLANHGNVIDLSISGNGWQDWWKHLFLECLWLTFRPQELMKIAKIWSPTSEESHDFLPVPSCWWS